MNFYNKSRKAIAIFTAVSGTLSILAVAISINPVQAQTLQQVQKIAQEITVRVEGGIDSGSGVIIAKQDSTYYVLTAEHVVKTDYKYEIVTSDNKKYPVNATTITKFKDVNQKGVDLAVVTFVSKDTYKVATISRYLASTFERRSSYEGEANRGKIFLGQESNVNQAIFVAGFPKTTGRYEFNPGRIVNTSGSMITNPINRSQGYRLVYSNLTLAGMSGGPVLDANGRLIGIHGRADGQNSADGRVVGGTVDEAISNARINFGNSLGIPITTFLALLPSTGIQINLNIEDTAPNSISKSQLESWISKQQEDNDRSINSLEKDPVYWINLGNKQWRLGNFQKSQEAFDEAIKIAAEFKNPFPQALYAKGLVAGFERKFDKSYQNCEKAANIAPKYYNAWRCKAGALYRLGRLSEAIEALDQAIEINKADYYKLAPDDKKKWMENPTDYTERGEILFAQGKPNEAIASFDKAIEIDPEMASAWSNRAFVQIAIQDFTSAESSIDRALVIDPNFAPAWGNRGLLLFNKKLYT
ncbi:MAG: tetratricopeptide repeat-containing serine protease family protein, partial [Pseudanabaena sp. ELA748]